MRLPRKGESGFTMLEMLISLAVLSMAMSGLASLLVQNSRINKQQQMTAEVQANARNCLSLLVQRMRSAGWNPSNDISVGTLTLDADLSDDDSEIEIFADLTADGDTDEADEQVFIRHDASAGAIVWRRDNDVLTPFNTVAVNISNDANGDGTIEPMFTPDSVTAPTMVTIQVTAVSPVPDPISGDLIRYTVSSDVVLRKNI
ncbi:MAG: type II secretion system GspH family protein [Acidobacteriota bacterium]|nr:type II secretion system GspH family protein [Acidobacteriota bacterium]MDH3784692.1 type II secretion system GspH family protein [Acidobacteriota bacterium]